MAKNHDYLDAEADAALKALGPRGAETVSAIERDFQAYPLQLKGGAQELELSLQAPVKALLAKHLQCKPEPLLSLRYQLDAGTHRLRVRAPGNGVAPTPEAEAADARAREEALARGEAAGPAHLFELVFCVSSDTRSAEQADAAHADALKALAAGAADLATILSPSFRENHVQERKALPKSAVAEELEAALSSVVRGKGNTVVMIDGAARRRLFAEVIARSLANEYSSAKEYLTRETYEVYDLDPQSGHLGVYDARFRYAVYHERADGLWRISHLQCMVAPRERPASAARRHRPRPARDRHILAALTDRNFTPEQRVGREALEGARTELARLESEDEKSRKAVADLQQRQLSMGSKLDELKASLADYPAYAQRFLAALPPFDAKAHALEIAHCEKNKLALEAAREEAKKPVTRAEQELAAVEAPLLAKLEQLRRRLIELEAELAPSASDRADAHRFVGLLGPRGDEPDAKTRDWLQRQAELDAPVRLALAERKDLQARQAALKKELEAQGKALRKALDEAMAERSRLADQAAAEGRRLKELTARRDKPPAPEPEVALRRQVQSLQDALQKQQSALDAARRKAEADARTLQERQAELRATIAREQGRPFNRHAEWVAKLLRVLDQADAARMERVRADLPPDWHLQRVPPSPPQHHPKRPPVRRPDDDQ